MAPVTYEENGGASPPSNINASSTENSKGLFQSRRLGTRAAKDVRHTGINHMQNRLADVNRHLNRWEGFPESYHTGQTDHTDRRKLASDSPIADLYQQPLCPYKDMTTAICVSAKATSSAAVCDDYDVTTTKMLSQTKSRDNDHDYTSLTQVSSTNTIHSDLTVMPNTNTNTTPNMEGGPSNATDMQPQTTTTRPKTKESQKSSCSRASSTSERAHTRSTSSSTAGNSSGRRPGPSRRTTSQSVQQQQQQQQMSPQKREQLIALHRESRRLFQDVGTTPNNNNMPVVDPSETRSMASPAASPMLQSQRSHSFPLGSDHDISDEYLLPSSPKNNNHNNHNRHLEKLPRCHTSDGITPPVNEPQTMMIPATITEWTSPSTRRREYEKIDRNNKGFRRLWRRWTPSCMRAGNERVPFFDETCNGGKKKNYEGSVRRFRMDIPDEEDDDAVVVVVDREIEKEVQISTKGMAAGPKVDKGRWSCF
ncbi:conserved hypothetical protein [Talaromyces marneffei ATCC 18224]|uniref:Uncharacterized protein n=2 Tax=Talaromyces marneffei TaxID=37727 RepID=B6Q927_TALMQ|nr:conserved hypothetical protein [Talaromyces marneffei ATCC 18224]